MSVEVKKEVNCSLYGLILGIFSIILFFVPFLNAVLSVLAIAVSIKGLIKEDKFYAMVGLILGIIGLVIALIWMFFLNGIQF
jgi:hypothetical protein